MKTILTAVLALVALSLLVFATYSRFPKRQIRYAPDYRIVYNTRIYTTQQTITVDGKEFQFDLDIPVQEAQFIKLTSFIDTEFAPSLIQWLSFIIFATLTFVYFVYVGIVLTSWGIYKLRKQSKSRHTEDSEQRVNDILVFTTGAILGLLGATDLSRVDIGNSLADDMYYPTPALPESEQPATTKTPFKN